MVASTTSTHLEDKEAWLRAPAAGQALARALALSGLKIKGTLDEAMTSIPPSNEDVDCGRNGERGNAGPRRNDYNMLRRCLFKHDRVYIGWEVESKVRRFSFHSNRHLETKGQSYKI